MSYTVHEIADLNESIDAAIASIKKANAILEEMMATGRIYVEEWKYLIHYKKPLILLDMASVLFVKQSTSSLMLNAI